MQLQQLGLSGYGYSPTGTGAGATGGASTTSGGATSGSASGLDPSAIGLTSSVAALADVRESESLDFQLADGTEVSISMRAHATALGASQTLSDGSASSAAALIASGQLKIEVKGNLSSDDLTAINNVVSQVDSLATQFFSGDAQGAFAAAASLNMDPGEIAGFSLKLSYSSQLFQQATANAAAPAPATATTGSTAPASAVTTSPTTSITPGSTSAATTTSDSSSGTSASTASSASGATPTASPQQIIINFVQQAMAKLRVSSGGSGERGSSHWKMKLLAQALPAYAQASPAATTAPAQSAAAPQPATGITVLQAARLAAATLNRLATQ